MDSKEIRELIEIISRSSFQTFELEREGFRLKLVKAASADAAEAARGPAPRGLAEAVVAPSAPAALEVAAPPTSTAPAAGLLELRSPIVGTFYRAPGAEAPPLTEVGSSVRKGQVLCIVEAMKVMNEIECEIDGEVVEIPVANGQPVEYGEVLFRFRPAS